jgi:hypothetical protein
MKFKLIFFLFNFMIIFSLLLVLVSPFFVIGPEYALFFFSQYWPIAVAFIVVLIIGDLLFAANWKFLTLMEAADWENLIVWLEEKILVQKKIASHELSVLLSLYVVHSKSAKITEMENFLRTNAPSKIKANYIYFAVPHLVGEDKAAKVAWFEKALPASGGKTSLWMRWCLGMVYMLAEKSEEAGKTLAPLLSCNDKLLNVLSAYLLSGSFEAYKTQVETIRNAARKSFTRETFARYLESRRDNILATLMMKIVDDAVGWIFA